MATTGSSDARVVAPCPALMTSPGATAVAAPGAPVFVSKCTPSAVTVKRLSEVAWSVHRAPSRWSVVTKLPTVPYVGLCTRDASSAHAPWPKVAITPMSWSSRDAIRIAPSPAAHAGGGNTPAPPAPPAPPALDDETLLPPPDAAPLPVVVPLAWCHLGCPRIAASASASAAGAPIPDPRHRPPSMRSPAAARGRLKEA